MKSILSLSLTLSAALLSLEASAAQSGRPDVYTTRILHVKSDVTQDSAKKTLEAINVVLAKTKGFEKRNLFYDQDQKVWIDQIKWKHLDAAKSGLKILEGDPAFTNVNKIIDEKATVRYQAERVVEYDAPK